MAIGDVPLTPIIDTVTGSVTEIGRIFLRTLTASVGALAPIDAAYWTSRGESVLTAEVNLGALASGYLKLATAVGIATPTTVPAIPQTDVTGLAAALAGKAAAVHAPTHGAAGADALGVTTLAGYPGGTATFLRADGTFAAPPVAAHHATHEPGGPDALVGAAWLALANLFSADQTITKASAALWITDSSQAVDARVFRVGNIGARLHLEARNDANTLSQGDVAIDRTGSVRLSADVYEKARTTPVGHWIDYVPTITASAGTVTVNSVATCRYALVGKTLTIAFYGTVTPSATPAGLFLSLPAGVTAAAVNTFGLAALHVSLGPGVVQTQPGGTTITVLRDISSAGTFPAAAIVVGFTHTFAIA